MAPYRTQSPDTSEAVDRMIFDLYRRRSPEQAIQAVWELNEWSWSRARVGLRERYPRASEREIELRLATLKYGREFVQKTFGWDPGGPEGSDGAA